MDSLTQAALGAAIGEAMLGRRHGRKAAIWGALCATLPDLDVFYPFAGGAVGEFVWHRGYSHSLPVMALAAVPLAWLILRIHQKHLATVTASASVTAMAMRGRWFAMVLLVLITHALLDCMTVYGTRVFLPFSDYPVSVSAIFIIDPFYTVPLLAGVLCAQCLRGAGGNGWRLNLAGLTVSSLYLCLALVMKVHVNAVTEQALADQGISSRQYLTVPMPFNILLWRIVVMEDGAYREGFYSVLDDRNAPLRLSIERNEEPLIAGIDEDGPIRWLRDFSHGFYKVWRDGERVVVSDLRMGMLGSYVFSFAVAVREGNQSKALPAAEVELLEQNRANTNLLQWLWRRIGDSELRPPTFDSSGT